jgi:hypothetical protein
MVQPGEPGRTKTHEALMSVHSRDSYPMLTRSIFDIHPVRIAKALLLRDEMLPILAAAALRSNLASEPTWDRCAALTEEVVDDVTSGPTDYAEAITNMTRNSHRFDEQRAAASGVLFHGSDEDVYNGGGRFFESLDYGLLWAYERNAYGKVDLEGKAIGTFVVRNSLGAHLRGDYPGEVVQPALVFNSDIESVVLTYNLTPNQRFSVNGSYVVVEPSEGGVLISECSAIGNKSVSGQEARVAFAQGLDLTSVASATLLGDAVKVDGPECYQQLFST